MKERPILFSGPMVRAILNGTKTQTRRAVKGVFRHEYRIPPGPLWCDSIKDPEDGHPVRLDLANNVDHACPYGQPGDRLWVRETHLAAAGRLNVKGAPVYFRSDGDMVRDDSGDRDGWWMGDHFFPGAARPFHWTPAIHMPRRLSRILLEITDIRVERLQEISRGDAMEEGCSFSNMETGPDPRQWYKDLWGKINGPGSWEGNPWVWVVSFRKLPNPDADRGGIIGSVEIVDCVDSHPSSWFMGRYGFVLRNPIALPFRPFTGKLGFFDVPDLPQASNPDADRGGTPPVVRVVSQHLPGENQ